MADSYPLQAGRASRFVSVPMVMLVMAFVMLVMAFAGLFVVYVLCPGPINYLRCRGFISTETVILIGEAHRPVQWLSEKVPAVDAVLSPWDRWWLQKSYGIHRRYLTP